MTIFSSSQPDLPTIVKFEFPGYVLKHLGLRHFLLAGGGGSAKTGVRNEIQLFLLTYNQFSSLASKNEVPELRAKLTSTIDTGDLASMNADVLELDQNGKFVVAVGQDKYCVLYKSNGYELNGEEDEVESPSRLSLDLQQLHSLVSDHDAKDAYQKCIRFDRSGARPFKMATGGTDGHVRIWDVTDAVNTQDVTIEVPLIKEFDLSGGEVDDLDFSACGTTLSTVSHKEALFWNIERGTSQVLPTPEKIGNNFRVRAIRFTTIGRNNIVFVVAYQQRQRTSKQASFVTLWSYNRQNGNFNMLNVAKIEKAAISCITVSPDLNAFIACGSMEGTLYCFETENLQCVYTAPICHNSFITSVEFLPVREVLRPTKDQRAPPQLLPGPGCDAMAAVMSLSVDQTIKFHAIPFPKGASLTSRMLRLGLQLAALYFFLYFIFVR